MSSHPTPPRRLLFARGCRGGIVRSIQSHLMAGGHYAGPLDGIYGPGLERGVSEFQRKAILPVSGAIDDLTWTNLMRTSIPTVFERALQLTAAFEGHGFGTVRGNWDGAWLTWGIVGFTLKSGELTHILATIDHVSPNALAVAFGAQTQVLREILESDRAKQERWATAISEGVRVQEPWQSGFERLGDEPIVQALQLNRAHEAYFLPAVRTAATLHLISERGLALAFDMHVQNGGISRRACAEILARTASDEPIRRVFIADMVAESAKPEFREDVRARKLTLATGEGAVHGERFKTANWGIGEYSAPELAR